MRGLTEKSLQSSLAQALRQAMPGSVVFRHEDVMTAGIPDISVTWRGRTLWLELKLSSGQTRGIQALTITRLGRVGYSGILHFRSDGKVDATFYTLGSGTATLVFDRAELVSAIVGAMST